MLRPQTLLCALVAGAAVVLAACSTDSSDGARPARSTAAPSTTAAPTTTTTPPALTYQVKRGDTLTSIAKFFGVSAASVAQLNQLGSGDRLTEGQVLQIPPAPPTGLVVTPSDAPPGETFKLTLTGAKAGEIVTFAIDIPGGRKFTGSPHTASQDGVVTAGYMTDSGNNPGTYNVVATGDRGTSAQASFRVLG